MNGKRMCLFWVLVSTLSMGSVFAYTPTLSELAYLAGDCYNAYGGNVPVDRGYSVVNSRTKASGFQGVAYRKEDLLVIAFRGTVLTVSNNILADGGLIFNSSNSLVAALQGAYGTKTAGQAALDNTIEDAMNFYTGTLRMFQPGVIDNVVVVGHSLGGYLAQLVGSVNNVNTFTFNAPGGENYKPNRVGNLTLRYNPQANNKITNYVANGLITAIPFGTHIGRRVDIFGWTHSMDNVYRTIRADPQMVGPVTLR